MNECLAWLGALIDGEGTLTHYVAKRQNHYVVSIPNQELELISGALRIVGKGNVSLQRRAGVRQAKRDIWVWYVCNKADVMSLARDLEPYSIKAQRFLEVEA